MQEKIILQGVDKKHRCRLCPAVPLPPVYSAYACPAALAVFPLRHSPARIPVRGVISAPVLRLRPLQP